MPNTPKILPVPQEVYPTHATLDEAVDVAKAQLPIEDPNQLVTVMMSYHNTLLQEIS